MEPRMTREQALAALATMTDADFPTVPPEDEVSDDLVERLIEAGRKATGRPSLTAPGKHSPQVTVRLPEAVNEQLTVLADRTGRRRSQLVRDAIDEYLKTA